jgi:hypothetical protein
MEHRKRDSCGRLECFQRSEMRHWEATVTAATSSPIIIMEGDTPSPFALNSRPTHMFLLENSTPAVSGTTMHLVSNREVY